MHLCGGTNEDREEGNVPELPVCVCAHTSDTKISPCVKGLLQHHDLDVCSWTDSRCYSLEVQSASQNFV